MVHIGVKPIVRVDTFGHQTTGKFPTFVAQNVMRRCNDVGGRQAAR